MNEQEQKHTPGPWEIRKDGAYPPRYLITSKGRSVASLEGWAYDGVITEEEDAANRNLIAAAPELLSALKGIIDQACVNGCPEFNHADGEGSYVVHSEACEAARAAINRVEGGAE